MLKTTLALAFAFAVPAVTLATPGEAQACAMMKAPRPMMVAKAMKKAKAAEKRGEDRTALRLYERAMRGRGTPAAQADAAFAAARIHAKLGRGERAMGRLSRAIQLNPKHIDARLAYAKGLLPEGGFEAQEHLDAAKALPMSDLQKAHWHLATALTKDHADALTHLKQAEALGASPETVAATRRTLGPAPIALRL